MKKIIDISGHTFITSNFDDLKLCDGVYIKATEGCTFISRLLDTQIQECRKRGIPYGLYHFARGEHSASEEYNFFKSVAEKYSDRQLPDCLDYEIPAESVSWVNEFMNHDSEMIFYSYRSMCWKTDIPHNKMWIAIPSPAEPALNGYLGVQYGLSVNFNRIYNCDVSVFDDSIIKTPIINKVEEVIKSMDIKTLQSWLNQNGFTDENNTKLVVDGVEGTHTKSAKAKAKSILSYILK